MNCAFRKNLIVVVAEVGGSRSQGLQILRISHGLGVRNGGRNDVPKFGIVDRGLQGAADVVLRDDVRKVTRPVFVVQ